MKSKTRFFDVFRNIIRITNIDRVLRSFTQGRRYDTIIGKMVPNIYQYPPGTIRTFNSGGINFEVDIHDYVGHYIYYGFYDISQSELFGLCRKGDIILDIGTNIGYSLLNMATIAGPEGFVLGFEPDPVNFSRLQKNISLNTVTNIKANQVGLGDKPGKFILENVIEFNSGGKRIASSGIAASDNFSEVEITTLDDFLATESSVTKIDVVKIDVEGFEHNVLKGGINTIRKYMPVLFIELDDNNLRQQSSSAKQLIQFLSETGYSVINSETKLQMTAETDFSNCHYDIICRRKSHT